MEGGPKLRRWYGSDSSVGAPGEERVERKAPSSDVADADARASGSIGFDEATLRAFDAKPRRSVLVAGADTAHETRLLRCNAGAAIAPQRLV